MKSRPVSNTQLVAHLRAKRIFRESQYPKLIGTAVTFFFEDTPELDHEIQAFFNREALVEPSAMCESLRVIRSMIMEFKRASKTGGDRNE